MVETAVEVTTENQRFAREFMTTLAPVYVEFRCSRCWQSNIAPVEQVGSEVECPNCAHTTIVPEATPERIERAVAILQSKPEMLAPSSAANSNSAKSKATDFHRTLTDREIEDIVRRESFVPLAQRNFQGYSPASVIARVGAHFLDNLAYALSSLGGFFLILWLSKQGMGIENPLESLRREEIPDAITLAFIFCPPILLMMVQWFLIYQSGQSLGKKVLMIRIVTTEGNLPGFVRGVVLRSWVPYFVFAIPFYGRWLACINSLFLLTPSRRCLHDYLAGTRVVSLL